MTSVLLATHEDDGDRLSEEELISTQINMVGADSQTTAAVIDHAVFDVEADDDRHRMTSAISVWGLVALRSRPGLSIAFDRKSIDGVVGR
ncbi:hypothetical protein [Streptomyces sp. NPDC053560]|uniref:hypothetical protein n=1 Tax=Streptomyces sp. NPDC053560 TaxID=3365711 RepID=UPI0037D27DD8